MFRFLLFVVSFFRRGYGDFRYKMLDNVYVTTKLDKKHEQLEENGIHMSERVHTTLVEHSPARVGHLSHCVILFIFIF